MLFSGAESQIIPTAMCVDISVELPSPSTRTHGVSPRKYAFAFCRVSHVFQVCILTSFSSQFFYHFYAEYAWKERREFLLLACEINREGERERRIKNM